MTRDDIKRVALELFRHYSYVKTSVSDIASATGIGKGTIYLSFKTKEDILFALLDDEIGSLQEQNDAFFRDPGVLLDQKIELFAKTLLDLHFQIRDLMFGSFENVEGRELQDVYLKFSQYFDRAADSLQSLLGAHGYAADSTRLTQGREFILFLSGRIIVYILSHDWNSREGIYQLMPVWARQIFHALVLQERR